MTTRIQHDVYQKLVHHVPIMGVMFPIPGVIIVHTLASVLMVSTMIMVNVYQ